MVSSVQKRCEFCGDEIINAEDYSNHLMIVHNMMKSIDQIVERLNKPINNTQGSDDEIEIIELNDDDDDEDNIPREMSSSRNDIDNQLEIQKLMEETAREMFKDLHLMLDGILPDITDEEKQEIENLKDIKIEIPSELTDCFDELSSIVNNFEIPKDYFQQKLSSISLENDDISKKAPKTLSTPKSLNSNPEQEENSTNKKIPKIVPKPGQTLYFCPFDKCDFYTTKKGFHDKTAALHLTKDHKITPEKFCPGKYKFQKLKGEKIQAGAN